MSDVDRAAERGAGFQRIRGFRSLFASVLTSSKAPIRSQDAPRACAANNDLLAMRRLARPSSLNSCASFLAKPCSRPSSTEQVLDHMERTLDLGANARLQPLAFRIGSTGAVRELLVDTSDYVAT
jgi:hypothetical protein